MCVRLPPPLRANSSPSLWIAAKPSSTEPISFFSNSIKLDEHHLPTNLFAIDYWRISADLFWRCFMQAICVLFSSLNGVVPRQRVNARRSECVRKLTTKLIFEQLPANWQSTFETFSSDRFPPNNEKKLRIFSLLGLLGFQVFCLSNRVGSLFFSLHQ